MKLIDSHAHLEQISDLEKATYNASRVGVIAVVTAGSDHKSNECAIQISEVRRPHLEIYPALGIHPCNLDASQISSSLEFIERHAHQAVGIGEIGLDYWFKEARKDPAKQELQRSVFKSLLRIAGKYDKPVIVHSRGAWEDCFQIVKDSGIKKAVFHWFTGSLETLDGILDCGYFVSATPAAEYSKEHREVIMKTPLERILLETDSPVSYRGKEAAPADVVKTLKAVANLKKVEEDKLANITTENAIRLFGLKGL